MFRDIFHIVNVQSFSFAWVFRATFCCIDVEGSTFDIEFTHCALSFMVDSIV